MTQLTPIKGFNDTPVTRTICVVSTLAALLLSILTLKHYVHLELNPHIVEYAQYWRVLTYQLCCVNESDFALSTFLWFYFKNLERFYGSRKYLLIISVVYVANMIAVFLTMCLGQVAIHTVAYILRGFISPLIPAGGPIGPTMFNSVTPGPLAMLSLLYVLYGKYIPVLYQFKIVLAVPWRLHASKQLTLTNHFPIHIVFTMFVLNNGVSLIMPCVIGLVVGTCYTQGLLVGKGFVVPEWAFQLFIDPLRFLQPRPRARSPQTPQAARENPVELPENDEPDRPEEVVEDGRQRESTEIRAETPVRPLGSQFLDNFRN